MHCSTESPCLQPETEDDDVIWRIPGALAQVTNVSELDLPQSTRSQTSDPSALDQSSETVSSSSQQRYPKIARTHHTVPTSRLA